MWILINQVTKSLNFSTFLLIVTYISYYNDILRNFCLLLTDLYMNENVIIIVKTNLINQFKYSVTNISLQVKLLINNE